MPLFQNSKSLPASILCKDGPQIIAYRLTPAAIKRLREAGVRHGREVSVRLLSSLIRTGEAHSPHPADATGQSQLFKDDMSDHLPRCELTGTTSDLHLVTYGEGNGRLTRLLGADPRFVLQKVTTLSMPINTLTSASLSTLECSGKVAEESAAIETLRKWLRQDFEQDWETLTAQLSSVQPSLGLEIAEDELKL